MSTTDSYQEHAIPVLTAMQENVVILEAIVRSEELVDVSWKVVDVIQFFQTWFSNSLRLRISSLLLRFRGGV